MPNVLRRIARLFEMQQPTLPREFRDLRETRRDAAERPDLSWVAYRLHE